MPHFHLQLFASRLNEISRDYLRQVNWVYEGVVAEIDHLLGAIETTCSKQQVFSPRSYSFMEVDSQRDILRFFNPIQCCEKSLLNSDTLILHLMQHGSAGTGGRREELDSGTKRLAILFNLFVQLATGLLVRYDNNYEQIEQHTVQLLRKTAEYLDCIQRKPIRVDDLVAVLFTENVTFAKWKYVFDYSCRQCMDRGIDNCRYEGAIAWYKIHLNSMGANPIRHLGTKMHALSLRDCLPDRMLVAVRPEVRAAPQLPSAAKYLMEAREFELDKQCTIGTLVQRTTSYEAVYNYLNAKLGTLLQESAIESFGSRVTGLATQESDLDVSIKVGSNMQPKTVFQRVLGWAKKDENKPEVTVELLIPKGPLVLRLKIRSLQLTIDLTFNSPYVVGNAKIVEYFFRLQPMARKLYFLLKEWKKRTEISNNFHHNVLISLIVFYMQTEHCLPPIFPLIDGPQKINNLYNTTFIERITLYAEPINFLTLVKDFFAYWARFDWVRNGASVKDATVKPKSAFPNPVNHRQPMVVTDYFDVTRNVAGNVPKEDCDKFVQACKEAVYVLKTKRAF